MEIKSLLEKASKDAKSLRELKNLAIKFQEWEIVDEWRRLEVEFFPETDEEIAAKEKAKELALAFRMVDLNIEDEVCFRIFQTLELFRKKKGKFDLKDASEIQIQSKKLFSR